LFKVLKVLEVNIAKAMGAFNNFIFLKTISRLSAHCSAEDEKT
jgi:hypothetical protein